jgi:transitional endoplasmic reticulum ATPase
VRFDEGVLGVLLDTLGSGKQVTLEEILPAIEQLSPDKEGRLNRGHRRKYLVDQMAERGLQLVDEPRDKVISAIAQDTDGFVGSDLEGLCREAGIFAMREGAATVTMRHFEQSIDKVHPTMNERLREFYTRIKQHFKGGLPREVQPPEYQ